MKKMTMKKLTVSRETLRNLETRGLQEVRGGLIITFPMSRSASGEDCCISGQTK